MKVKFLAGLVLMCAVSMPTQAEMDLGGLLGSLTGNLGKNQGNDGGGANILGVLGTVALGFYSDKQKRKAEKRAARERENRPASTTQTFVIPGKTTAPTPTPGVVKPGIKPVETKPVEVKKVETKPIETKPVETKPVEILKPITPPVVNKPAEVKQDAPMGGTLFDDVDVIKEMAGQVTKK